MNFGLNFAFEAVEMGFEVIEVFAKLGVVLFKNIFKVSQFAIAGTFELIDGF